MNSVATRPSIRMWLLVAAAAPTMACSGGADPSGSAGAPAPDDPPGSIRVDNVLLVPLTPDWKPTLSPKPYAEQTLDELAETLRPMMGRADENGTKFYRGAEPAYDLAQAVKNGTMPGPASQPGGTVAGSGVKADYFFDINNAGTPIVADNTGADNTSAYPYNSVVFLQTSGGSCSAEAIGPHSTTTAAHCLSQGGVNYSNFKMTPGAFGYGGGISSSANPTYPPSSGAFCFSWAWPSGWNASCPNNGSYDNSCTESDFAIFDFRCGNTVPFSHWFGYDFNDSSFPAVRLDGYPGSYTFTGNPPDPVGGSTYPGCGTNTNPTSAFPFLCGSSGPASLNNVLVESNSNISSPGFSGGPWWKSVNGSPLVLGINHGEGTYFDFTRCGFNTCYRNLGRWFDSTVYNFFFAHSEIGH